VVNVSKNKLKPKVVRDITRQFVATISQLDRESAETFFKAFFTPAERLLFAKRLATVYLLRKGVSAYRIAQLLKISRSTVQSLDERFSRLEQEALILTCERFDKGGGLLGELQDLLFRGFSMNPKQRARWLNEFEQKYRT